MPHFSISTSSPAGRNPLITWLDEAIKLLSEALVYLERSSERWFEPELHRLRGKYLLMTLEPAAAEAAFEQALVVAEAQGINSWKLRAATSLAELWHGQNKSLTRRLRRRCSRRVKLVFLIETIDTSRWYWLQIDISTTHPTASFRD